MDDSAKPVPDSEGERLSGGRLLAAISTAFVAILRDHYGRGPMKAKTYALDDLIVVVMRGSGFTPLEQTIMDSGEPDRVIAMREDFQRVMADRYRQTIRELTGRGANGRAQPRVEAIPGVVHVAAAAPPSCCSSQTRAPRRSSCTVLSDIPRAPAISGYVSPPK